MTTLCNVQPTHTSPRVSCLTAVNPPQVLKFETKRQAHALGGSVFGYNDAYRRLHPFLKQWQLAQTAMASDGTDAKLQHCPDHKPPTVTLTQNRNLHLWQRDQPQAADASASSPAQAMDPAKRQPQLGMPYIVSVDVSRAFDNIDAEMLLRIVEPLFQSQEYLIIKYAEVCRCKNRLTFLYMHGSLTII